MAFKQFFGDRFNAHPLRRKGDELSGLQIDHIITRIKEGVVVM